MTYQIRRAAVIGSGTMGGAIAAHFANVGVPVDLLDIAPKGDEPPNSIVERGWKAVTSSSPAALYHPQRADYVRLGNLAEHFDRLAEADWIIEVIVENLAIKQNLMAKIEEVRQPTAIISTNTSGLRIHAIAEGRSEGFRQHFLGTHFFNPPRYLKLLEIIPHTETSPAVMDFVTRFGEEVLGKGVVICKDTPNFIANRLFSLGGAYELAYAVDNGYSIEEVDNLMGELVGRPKTAVFRLLDLVGLDVMGYVNENLHPAIPDDEARDLLRHKQLVNLIEDLVARNYLGNKTKVGFYKRVEENGKKEFWTLDFDTLEHTPAQKVRFESVGKHRKLDSAAARLKAMVNEDDRAAEYVRHVTYHRLSYAANRIPEISDDLVSIDRAIRWGFAHEMGPFEEWDALGVAETVERMEESGFAVAQWVKDMLASGHERFYQTEDGVAVGYYDIASGAYVRFEDDPKALSVQVLKARNGVVDGNDEASIVDMGDGIALFEWHSKAYTMSPAMIEMGYRAIERASSDFDGLVVGHDGRLFSGGANLDMQALQKEAKSRGVTPADVVDDLTRRLQNLMLGFRYAPVPIVTAPFDRALGGGAELSMAGDRTVAHSEFYVGLVEAGLGLLPAATGTKEMLRRIVNPHMQVTNADPIPVLQQVLETLAFAKVATSAVEARELGFLRPEDRIVVNRDHLLAEAKREARHMADAGYRPPLPEKIYAAGRDVLAAIRVQIFMLKDGNYASEHDAFVGEKIAYVLCGGDLSGPHWVDEEYILDLEREAFVELIQHPKTLERIMHMLKTGRPLRN
ncbi:MAG: 3-hydroxyacyl-CoA dehydrogenase/enoyl-CoA hydratase family protein [Chloroflexi bacterium]|nr:3-hydroxyacyl-CoA dehydrogenase/enoyl-CoA hydratase family protein [Chloroflexota bacterium]